MISESHEAIETLSHQVRALLIEQLRDKIESNFVDGGKSILSAVQMATMLDSPELITLSLRKMTHFLTVHDGRIYAREMYSLHALAEAWSVANKFLADRRER